MSMTPNPEKVESKQDPKIKNLEEQIRELKDAMKENDKFEGVFDKNQEGQSLEKTLNKGLEKALNKADKKTVKGLLEGVRKVYTDSSLNLDVDVKNDLKVLGNILTGILNQKDSEGQKERSKEQAKHSFEKFLDKVKDSSTKKLNLNQKDFNNLVMYISDPSNVKDSINLYKEMRLIEGRTADDNVFKLESMIESRAGYQVNQLNGIPFKDFILMLRNKDLTADDILNYKNDDNGDNERDIIEDDRSNSSKMEQTIQGVGRLEGGKFVFDKNAEKTDEQGRTYVMFMGQKYIKFDNIGIRSGESEKAYRIFDDGIYFGGFIKNGENYTKNGGGTLLLFNGNKYDGNWVNGEMNGEGACRYNDGSDFVGNWVNGQKDYGMMTWRNGSKYFGSWKNGKMNDENGEYTGSDHTRYVGNLVDGFKEGYGTQRWSDGSSFSGEWHGGKPIEGTLTSPDGTQMYGKWVEDGGDVVFKEDKQPLNVDEENDDGKNLGNYKIVDGMVVPVVDNGESGVDNGESGVNNGESGVNNGESGVSNGEGEVSNGDAQDIKEKTNSNVVKVSDVANDSAEGGNIKQLDVRETGDGSRKFQGDTFVGRWENGWINGRGKASYSNGDIYEGGLKGGDTQGKNKYTIKNDLPYVFKDGEGEMRYHNGDVYSGTFKGDGLLRGEMRYHNGDIYNGEFSLNNKHGKGIMKYIDGGVYEGEFKYEGFGKGNFNYNGISLDIDNGKLISGNSILNISGLNANTLKIICNLLENSTNVELDNSDFMSNKIILHKKGGIDEEFSVDFMKFGNRNKFCNWLNSYIENNK